MHHRDNLFSKLNFRILFLVWGSPDQGPRSRIMADKLGIEPHFISMNIPRGTLYIPIKYTVYTLRTILLFLRKQPQFIFVQNPPLLAVILAYVYGVLTGAGYIVDAHSEALLTTGWTAPPTWIKRFLAKRAITTIVTNEHLQEIIKSLGGHSLIIRDIPTIFDVQTKYPVNGEFNIALINTFASDEPLNEVLKAAANLSNTQFYVTGKTGKKHLHFVDNAPSNVHFTGFLPDQDYYALLNSAHAVMCLTTRNHTMQRGACEALSLGKPIITSDWPILRKYFNKGTIHVNNSIESIQQAVLQMQENLSQYNSGIKALQVDQQKEWQDRVTSLVTLIKQYHHTNGNSG